MKRFFQKGFLFVSPVLIWWNVELFVLPMDQFTFRVLEAVSIFKMNAYLPKGFYPNIELKKMVAGDLQPTGPRVKYVEWYTDRYGSRTRPEITDSTERFDMVVIGDSTIWGSHLDQKEMFAEVMMRKTGLTMYTYIWDAFATPVFLQDPRFQKAPPRIVVWQLKRGYFYSLREGLEGVARNTPEYTEPLPEAYYPTLILIDRFLKNNMWRYVRSRLGVAGSVDWRPKKTTHDIERLSEEGLEEILKFKERLSERGTKLAILVLPDPVRDFDPLIASLKDHGIPTVGYLPSPEDPQGIGLPDFWSPIDSHWNPHAVEKTADLMIEALGLERVEQ